MRTGCGRGAEAVNMTGAEILVRMLAEQNVTHVFGIPGGAVIPLYDALYDAPFVHLLMRHEQAAVHAADGFARATGEVGVQDGIIVGGKDDGQPLFLGVGP